MKRVMVSAAIIASMFTAAAPVAAQPGAWNAPAFWRGAPGSAWDRIAFLQRRIDNGIPRRLAQPQ
jgi:hypothetical protein